MATSRRTGLCPFLPQDVQDELKNRLRKSSSSLSAKDFEDKRNSTRLKVANAGSGDESTTAGAAVEHSDAISLVRNLTHLAESNRGEASANAAASFEDHREATEMNVKSSPAMRRYKLGEG